MHKLWIAAVVLVIVAVGSYFGYNKYQSTALIESTAPHVKETSLRTRVIIDLLTSPGSATFREMFEKSDETVKKIADTLFQLESQSSKANPEAMQSAIAYIKANQEITRTMLSSTRTRYESNNAASAMNEALADLKSSSGYSQTYARQRLERAVVQAKKLLEKSKNEIELAQSGIASLKNAHTSASRFFPSEALLSSDSITALESHFRRGEEMLK
jgi:predicted metal-dependent hydrolase